MSEIQNDDHVKLKSILGIKPGFYLAFIYAIIILVILFLIFINPGIKNPGTMLSVKTEPWGAAVLVDGAYMGASPCEVFVKKGHRTILLSLPGFVPKELEMDIGSRLFASAIFPLRDKINEELEPASAKEISEAFLSEASEYAAWSFAGEPSAVYQIPLSLSEGVYRFAQAAKETSVKKSMSDTIAASIRFASTRAGLRDLIRAKTLLDNQGLSPSPLSLLASAKDTIAFLESNGAAAKWLSETLQGEAASQIKSSSWYKTYKNEKALGRKTGSLTAYGNLRFLEIAVNREGKEAGRFYIAETPISPEAWKLFLGANPEWKIENIDTLTEKGLVDEQYLAEWELTGKPADIATWISWYAAKSWCQWYNSRLSASQGLEARLPTENEWEIAAHTGLQRVGDFWEWCEDPFVPLSFIAVQSEAALLSPERSLRGGAWVNSKSSVGIETRASLSPSSCSPFISFRPVLVPRGSKF